jgi:hypothetical protein
MVDISETLDNNKIRIVVCIVLLALGLYTAKALRDRRGRDNLWLITLFLTVVAVVGMWFTLVGTVQKGDKKEKQPPEKRGLLDYSNEEVPDSMGLQLADSVFLRPGFLVVNLLREVSGSSSVNLINLSKRACGDICPVTSIKPKSRSFYQKNKSRLITTGTTTAAGSTGAYAQRNSHKRAVIISVFLTLGVAVGLWFLIGEDSEQDLDERF